MFIKALAHQKVRVEIPGHHIEFRSYIVLRSLNHRETKLVTKTDIKERLSNVNQNSNATEDVKSRIDKYSKR